MKSKKNIALLFVLILFFEFAFIGCGESNTVSNYIVSDQQYTERSDLESATQPGQLTAGKNIYASVHFIESPKGMKYTAKWFINGKEVKTDNQKMPTDKRGTIVFSLEGNKVTTGTLIFEVSYDGDILLTKELTVVEE